MIKAIIPMKGHNERLPGKNTIDLCGKPLFAYLLKTLLETKIEQVTVDTDNPEIAKAVKKIFPEILIDFRPAEYCGDFVGGNKLLSRFVTEPEDIYVQSHATCPLIKARSIDKAIEMIESGVSSVFSVTKINQRLWMNGDFLLPVNHLACGPTLRTQDLPAVFAENAGFFAFRGSYFLSHNSRNGPESKMYELEFPENSDIDTYQDYVLVQSIIRSGLHQ